MDTVFAIIKTILVLLLLGLGLLLVLGSFSPKGFTARVVLSGSMEPAISTGSVIFTLPRDAYEVDDVITFRSDARAVTPTTHRVVEVKPDPLGNIYTTKGDANDTNDLATVRQGQVMGKVLFHVPYLGYVLDFAKQPVGFVVLIGFPALLIVIEEAKKIYGEIRRRRTPVKEEEEKTNL